MLNAYNSLHPVNLLGLFFLALFFKNILSHYLKHAANNTLKQKFDMCKHKVLNDVHTYIKVSC